MDNGPKKHGKASRRMERPRDPLRKMLDEHAARHHQRHEEMVEAIKAQALENLERLQTEGYSREMALAELEAARLAALQTLPVQAAAAVAATLAKAKIMGLVIDKQAVLHGNATTGGADLLTGDIRENQRKLIEDLRDRVGSTMTDAFVRMLRDMKMLPPPDEADEEDQDV